MGINHYQWIKVVGEDGTFYDYVPHNRKKHLELLRSEGYYAVPVRSSDVPPCRYRDFGATMNEYSYHDGVWHKGTDFYLPTSEEDAAALASLEDLEDETGEEKE